MDCGISVANLGPQIRPVSTISGTTIARSWTGGHLSQVWLLSDVRRHLSLHVSHTGSHCSDGGGCDAHVRATDTAPNPFPTEMNLPCCRQPHRTALSCSRRLARLSRQHFSTKKCEAEPLPNCNPGAGALTFYVVKVLFPTTNGDHLNSQGDTLHVRPELGEKPWTLMGLHPETGP